jgi:hypothetical protein
MNITNKGLPAKSDLLTVLPSVPGREKLGAGEASLSMVDSVSAIGTILWCWVEDAEKWFLFQTGILNGFLTLANPP